MSDLRSRFRGLPVPIPAFAQTPPPEPRMTSERQETEQAREADARRLVLDTVRGGSRQYALMVERLMLSTVSAAEKPPHSTTVLNTFSRRIS